TLIHPWGHAPDHEPFVLVDHDADAYIDVSGDLPRHLEVDLGYHQHMSRNQTWVAEYHANMLSLLDHARLFGVDSAKRTSINLLHALLRRLDFLLEPYHKGLSFVNLCTKESPL